MKDQVFKTTLVICGIALNVGNVAHAGGSMPTQYQALDLSNFKKYSTHSGSVKKFDEKLICKNRNGQSFDSTTAGYGNCYSEYESSRSSREFKDKVQEQGPVRSVGFKVK